MPVLSFQNHGAFWGQASHTEFTGRLFRPHRLVPYIPLGEIARYLEAYPFQPAWRDHGENGDSQLV